MLQSNLNLLYLVTVPLETSMQTLKNISSIVSEIQELTERRRANGRQRLQSDAISLFDQRPKRQQINNWQTTELATVSSHFRQDESLERRQTHQWLHLHRVPCSNTGSGP